MSKISGRVLLCLILAIGSPPKAQAQDSSDILNQDGDEQVTSLAERQQIVATLLSAAAAARENGDSLRAARFLNRVGRLQLLLTLPDEALKTYEDALSLVNNQDVTTTIASLNGQGAAYTYMRKCENAASVLNDSMELSRQANDNAGKAQALLTLSACQNGNNHALALKTAQEALELWKSVNHNWGMGKTYSAIGHYQLTLQNLAESAQSHEAAQAIWRDLKIPYEEAQALINLGFVEYRKAEWQKAISYLLQGQALLDPETYPYEMGQITITLGEIFLETGLPEAALLNLQQAAEQFGRSKEPLAIAVVSLDMGKTYYAMGKFEESIATLKRTIEAAQEIKEPNLIAMCHEFLGQTYVAMNETAVALVHFKTALDMFTETSGTMEAARVQARMGQVYAMQRKFEKANSYFTKALSTFQSLSDRLNESATLYALGTLKLQQEDLDAAETYLRQSISVTEDIRRTPTTSDLTAAFSATIHERYQRYIDCLMRKQKTRSGQDLAVTAFELSERGRGRSLKELLQATQTNLFPGVDPHLAQKERSLRQTLTVKENYRVTMLSRPYQPKELTALDTELAQLERQYDEVVQTLGSQVPAYLGLQQATSWNLGRIQEQVVVDDETVLVEFSIGTDRSYAWAVTRNDIESYELPSEAEITEATQKVYALLSESPKAETEAELLKATDHLSKLILSPLAASLNKRRIIVVADDVLNYIPFQILPKTSGQPERLIDGHEIINAPSASILGELRHEVARRQPAAKVLAAFGSPVFASNYSQSKGSDAGALLAEVRPETNRWRHALRDIEVEGDTIDPTNIQPLFYTTRELSNLRELVGNEILMMTGFDATREKLTNTDLSQYAILHFATHGVLDPRRPENSGLFLSMVNRDGQPQDGFIALQDIYGLNARVELVVLSACRTGLGKDVKGEGLIGLTRGFMYAGASSAVASLWSVDDEATAELMKHFYANMLQHKMLPAAALREAQNKIRQDPRWSSPYYWAAFTFQGDYGRHVSVGPGSWSTNKQIVKGLSVGLVLLALLALLAYKRRRSLRERFTRR